MDIFGTSTDIVKLLTDKFGNPTTTTKHSVWKTPYGVSFTRDNCMGDSLWFYRYDSDMDSIRPLENEDDIHGCMSGRDIEMAVNQLVVNPNKLREKPKSVKYFERLTGVAAKRKENAFGKWHIKCDEFSMFNNPFGLELGYTKGENEYEIWIFEEEEPRAYQSVTDVELALREYGYINPV